MEPAAVPAVSIYAGDRVEFPDYIVKDGDGVAINLTAYQDWQASWRKRTTSADAVSLTVDTSQAALGIISIVADSDATRAMGASGVWDVQATHPTFGVQTFVYGTTRWRADVTR